MNCLSPEAEKMIREARGRNALYWPALQRTSTKLIIRRPLRCNRVRFAQFMAERLSDFQFDNKHDWWEASLEESNYKAAVMANSVKLNRDRSEIQLRISEGMRDWLNEGKG